MRPPTHDDPHAVPRNGTDVPWLELDDPSHRRVLPREARHGDDRTTAAGQRQRRRPAAPA